MKIDFQVLTEGLTANFQLLSKVPASSTPSWDFGDDTEIEADKKTPSHTYGRAGIYHVTLKFENSTEGVIGEITKTVLVSDVVKTHLTDSIYNLIDYYIPEELVKSMTYEEKALHINKWQLYLQPLVVRSSENEIPLEQYNNELYYEGLENQLIMELAAFDYLYVKVLNILSGTGNYVREITSSKSKVPDTDEDPNDSARGDRVKRITTGPTEVEYYDTVTDSTSSLVRHYTTALKPGGSIDLLRQNLCMLASRLEIFLPICDKPLIPVMPDVVNRRVPTLLGGPNPTYPISTGDDFTIVSKG